ncbi:putative ABC-type sugar transport system, permease component [Sphaerochaeta pleomorpha str. Grapes]|uniref:Putative ABC-type sugar transport system, permease component n=2 Tax=Sphaerochaeta TaxID=399320 RepID=G8QTF7_SPHPG|nr:putative ABC-type sugar transport system, permease component [Sphaerochaeta pleomorpha str. Grapes]
MRINRGVKSVEENRLYGYLRKNTLTQFIRNNMGILIGLFVLSVILTIFTETFLNSKNLLTVLRQICTNSLLAFGMTFVLIIGEIDLTVGSVVGASGVAVVMLIESGVPLVLAFLIALLLGALVGLINGLIIAFIGMPSFIVTLSMMGTIRGVAYYITDGRSVACTNSVFNSIGNGYILGVPIPIYVVALVMIIISVILYRTKFGRRMYAVGGNVTAAKYTGIRIKSMKIKVYMISSTLAALAGIMLASRMYSGQPTAGQNYEADAIAAAVLGGTSFTGGIGTIGGTLIGALVIGILSNGLNLLHISSYIQMVIKGIVIILAVAFDFLKNRKGNV